MSEIDEAIKNNRTVGESTKKTYISVYKRLLKLTDDKPILSISEDNIIKSIHQEDIPPQSQNTLLSVAIYIRRNKDLKVDKLIKFRDTTLAKEKLAYKEKKNKSLQEDLPSLEKLENHTKILFKKEQYVSYIINFLMLRYGVRNKDLNLVLTKNKDVISVGYKSKVNYLYVTQKYTHFVRNDYKTFETYGRQKHRIEKSQFNRAVKAVLGDEYEKQLLGQGVSEDSVSKIIQRNTFDELGEGKYFKIQLRDLKNQGNIKRIRELAKSRGTDLETVFQEYDITG